MKSAHDDQTPTGSRFIVGIDLGTTNSALAYVDTAEADERPVRPSSARSTCRR